MAERGWVCAAHRGLALLVAAQSLPAVLLAAAATGFAGALFNPGIRAYLAADVGDGRVQAFAMFNIFNQAGSSLGPLVGLALMAIDFRVAVAAAASIFAVLTVAQLLLLPRYNADPLPKKTSILRDWRAFQVYLALPLQASRLAPRFHSALVATLFAISGLTVVGGQLRITRWSPRLGARDAAWLSA
jgi:MFS family permease